MKNINFDNPYLLLLILPVIAAVLIPFFIAIRRENKSGSAVASLILHMVIVLLVGVAAAGIFYETTVTRTEVVVVADVSYSTNEKLDAVDAHIQRLQASLPNNTQMGVVCFGKDPVLHTQMGGTLTSVKEAQVDSSATNIYSAVEYASTLFSEDAIKRIVLITDGADTDEDGIERMITTVDKLAAARVQIDAIYIDSNLAEGTKEAQISGVTFSEKTYINHDTAASVLVQSSTDAKDAFLTLSRDGEEVIKRAIALTKGYNVFHFDMPTETAGTFDYTLTLGMSEDTTAENNAYRFVQNVSADLDVLFLSASKADLDRAISLYGDRANIHAYMDVSRKELKEIMAYTTITVLDKIPMTVEELCVYDEIVLSNIDVREIENVSYFIEIVGKVVSEFGKSLVTIGDTQIQNKTDETLKKLEEMLPVRFGNNDQAPKLYGIVIDCSRSMYTASRLTVAKRAATYLVNLLNDGDYVTVIGFAGESFVVQDPVDATNREEIARKIEERIQPQQGTYIGGGLEKTYNEFLRGELASMYSEKQIMLISDGLTFTAESTDAGDMAEKMLREGDVVTSVINPYCNEQDGIDLLERVARQGGGKYYYIANENELVNVMFSEIAADVTESVVEKELAVEVNRGQDAVLKGLSGGLPNIYGFIQSVAKPSSTVVLTVSPDEIKEGEDEADRRRVPLYAYRDYGNGRVTSLTTSLSGDWVAAWQEERGTAFMQNILKVNTPEEKIDYPYRLTVEDLGGHINVEIMPLVINPNATATVILTLPTGEQITEQLIFDSEKYFYSFAADTIGKYQLTVQYAYQNFGLVDKGETDALVTYESVNYFTRSYSREYDRFVLFSPSALHSTIRHRGTVLENGEPDLTPDEGSVVTYTIDLVMPAAAAAVILFVIDIIVRKIKKADIVSLFVRRKKGGAGK